MKRILWDSGEESELTPDRLPSLGFGYAVTIGKSQDDQLRRGITSFLMSLLPDRTLPYTFVTQAESPMIPVSEVAEAKTSVKTPFYVSLRQVGRKPLLKEILEGQV